jgi:PAS domain S-box-containing protein
MAHVDPEGRWLEANPQLCEIVGYSPDELTSLTLRDLTHPDDLNADLEYIRRALSDNIRAYSLQKRYVRKDGTPVWIDLTSSLVRDGAGKPRYFIKIVRLLSPRSQIDPGATPFEGVAHDLNDLLFIILSYVELSMGAHSPSSPQGHDLREIQRAALRAQDLTRYLVKLRER